MKSLAIELEYDGQEDEGKILADFLSRQETALARVGEIILEIKKRADKSEHIDELKKIFQSLRIESGMLGMSTFEAVCYEVENLVENKIKKKHVEALLEVKDWLKKSLDSLTGQGAAPCPAESIIAKLKLIDQSVYGLNRLGTEYLFKPPLL